MSKYACELEEKGRGRERPVFSCQEGVICECSVM